MKTKDERFELSRRYADELRARATPAEKELCRLLDEHRVSYVFQSNVCDEASGRVYVCDFRIRRAPARPKGTPRDAWRAESQYKLFVEVDGSFHDQRQAYDAKRTRWLEAHRGAKVLRFSNADIFERPGAVLAAIESHEPAKRTARISYTSAAAASGWRRAQARRR